MNWLNPLLLLGILALTAAAALSNWISVDRLSRREKQNPLGKDVTLLRLAEEWPVST